MIWVIITAVVPRQSTVVVSDIFYSEWSDKDVFFFFLKQVYVYNFFG